MDYRRAGVSETTIHGAVAWAHGGEVIHAFGGNVLCYGRSMMKPLMMKVFADVLDDLSWEQRAISVASHNGTPEHIAAAQSILSKGEWGLMQTPLDVPLVQFGRQVRRPRRWYHCCSGEHAAILRGAQRKGWPRVGYMLPGHPFFKGFVDVLRRDLGEDWEPARVARDGCGLPTVANTVSRGGALLQPAARREDWIWEAMTRAPDLVGGFNRLDSTILKAVATACWPRRARTACWGSPWTTPVPRGLGIVIKIAHGWNAGHLVHRPGILGSLGIELRNPYKLHRQKAFLVPGVVPERRLDALVTVPTWDEWDPDIDRYQYDWRPYVYPGSKPGFG